MTEFFFLNDNTYMPNQEILLVEFRDIPHIQVAQKLCLFTLRIGNYDKKIQTAFRELREWTVSFSLSPDELLHIGIPTLEESQLVMYECCIEFPLPFDAGDQDVKIKTLPGGKYVVLSVEKKPQKIQKAIRQFRGDYIPEHQILIDVRRPTYEIYYEDLMEYCLPIIG